MSDKNNNPANEIPGLPEGYIPMTTGTLRLETPKRDGWHRHWFRGTPERIQRAQRAGYRFVDSTDETVQVRNFDLGGSDKQSGNSDLGSRVSVISGDDLDSVGQPGRLYLMECPQNIYEHAKRLLADRNEDVAASIRGGSTGKGSGGETAKDAENRYTRDTQNLFTRKNRSP